ncbi:MAG TPA: HEAT repeat domain-containing protein [Gemmatimonadaceae bacterium]
MNRVAPVVTMLLACASSATAQSLNERVARAPEGPVQFSFAARPGVCGNGRTFIQVSPNSYVGNVYVGSDGASAESCVAGPVRVVIDRAGRIIVAVQAYVGPDDPATSATSATSATNLGRVRGQDAAIYLLSLATSVDGRAGRDAILPAALADSANVGDKLLAIARDHAVPRETRRAALTWVGRALGGVSNAPSSVTSQLLSLASDDSDNLQVRQAALGVLSRLEHGAGIPTLIDLSRQSPSVWLQKEATLALARSGDPRARESLRTLARRSDVAEDVLVTALRSLGQEYATAQDAALLRELYPRLTSDRARETALSTLAEIGGSENTRWLLQIAASGDESLANRRRAVDAASRAGASISDLVKLYDTTTDPQMKDALVGIYLRSGEPAGVDKVLAIVKSEGDSGARRRVISRLSQSDDPRIKRALEELVAR